MKAPNPQTQTWLREMRTHLEHGIIPFWLTRAEDREHGGFLTNFDADGQPQETPEKYLNTQCRLIWWFAHLFRHRPDAQYARLARQGVDFLIAHLWDETHDGFMWKCHRDGRRLDDGKIVYGQSFAIHALSEYALATGDGRGLAYAHGLDRQYGGIYRDGLRSTGEAVVLEKEFWQNAEAMVGFLDGYACFGDARYLEALGRLWTFARDFLINADVGEWRTLTSRDGQVLDPAIGNPWKVSYHSGRAILECVTRLETLG